MLKIQKKVDCWVMVEHVGGFSWPKGPHQPIFHVYSQPVRRFARLLPGRSKQAGHMEIATGGSHGGHQGGRMEVDIRQFAHTLPGRLVAALLAYYSCTHVKS